eukprot:TRINITY_DN990_c0_g1_i1.p1 TRINITY_DN990_c0_g1~~TRINITY_DN990_c0_g1_i1.p1  ORF type:complete len:290 (-),score=70.48 TRINITY_DN990_c0_g1_i1:89-958(-)
MATLPDNQHNHSHSHENGGSNDAAYPAHWQKTKIPAHLRPQKFNSTSSLYIDSTISKPKNAELMHCIAVYFVKQINDPSQHNKQDKTHQNNYSIFDESVHPLTSKNVNTTDIPSVETVEKMIKSIFKIGQLAPESLIMAVAYLERINRTSSYRLFAYNWKRTLLSTLILASKVWEDQAVWNIDFIELFPLTTPSDLGQLEKKILALLGFDVSLKASEYAKIYFDIRAQAAHHCADEHFLELKPLNKDNEDKLELRSQNYTLTYAKKLYRSSGSVDDIGIALKSPRTILN